jgi:hypothetical protein
MNCNDFWSARLLDFLNKIDLDALAKRTGVVFQQPSCLVSEKFTRGAASVVFEIVRNSSGINFWV